ncbi:MAG: SpoIIE family protein phosphatase [Acidimicrobiales bacterium]
MRSTGLGGFAHAPCRDRQTYLRPGDAVVFFTDGLTEEPTVTGLFSRAGVTQERCLLAVALPP